MARQTTSLLIRTMKTFPAKKTGAISLRVAVISLLVLVACSLCINIILESDFESDFVEFLYSTCYIMVFVSLFVLAIAVIILLISLFLKRR